MRDQTTIKAANGIGPAAGKSARDYLRERDARRATGQSQDARRAHPGRAMREAGMFASAAREIARLRRAGK